MDLICVAAYADCSGVTCRSASRSLWLNSASRSHFTLLTSNPSLRTSQSIGRCSFSMRLGGYLEIDAGLNDETLTGMSQSQSRNWRPVWNSHHFPTNSLALVLL